MENRINIINSLRGEGKTFEQIGQKLRPRVTAERVRQILAQKNLKQCIKHKTFFDKQCYKCSKDNEYTGLINQLKKDGLWNAIQKVQKHDRSRVMVSQRYLVIRRLKLRYKLSFRRIARLLKRDHASIMHLYYQ